MKRLRDFLARMRGQRQTVTPGWTPFPCVYQTPPEVIHEDSFLDLMDARRRAMDAPMSTLWKYRGIATFRRPSETQSFSVVVGTPRSISRDIRRESSTIVCQFHRFDVREDLLLVALMLVDGEYRVLGDRKAVDPPQYVRDEDALNLSYCIEVKGD